MTLSPYLFDMPKSALVKPYLVSNVIFMGMFIEASFFLETTKNPPSNILPVNMWWTQLPIAAFFLFARRTTGLHRAAAAAAFPAALVAGSADALDVQAFISTPLQAGMRLEALVVQRTRQQRGLEPLPTVLPFSLSKHPAAQPELAAEMLERLADVDEEVADLFLAEEEPPLDVLRAAIRRQTIAREFVPVFMGSAFKGPFVMIGT